MKHYRKAVIAAGIFYFLSVLFFAILTAPGREDPARESLILKLNEIVHTLEDNRLDPDGLGDTDCDVSYAVTDLNGAVLYTNGTVRDGRLPVETAIKKGYPYRYLFVDGQLRGVAVILDDGAGRMGQMRLRMLVGLCALGVLLLAAAAFFGRYVTTRIYRPFRELEDFAGRVAQGRLDEPLSMDRSNLFGVFSESFDIMREELKNSRMREVALQKREKELVASLSHDLKTPITGIKVTSELLSARLATQDGMADIAEKIGNIYQKADQIDVLVNDLFSATLEDLGEFRVSCTDEKAQILTEIVKKYDDRGLVRVADAPEVLIRIDARRMSQVIGNILANSYKYAGTAVEVSYRIVEEYLEMSIRDFGPGVPADELDRITGKFYRGRDWADSREEGSGLGLYIASTLMEKMDGELVPASGGPGKGLTITLMIPLS